MCHIKVDLCAVSRAGTRREVAVNIDMPVDMVWLAIEKVILLGRPLYAGGTNCCTIVKFIPLNCTLPLEFKPAYSVGDLLTQHLVELEQEAER